MATLQYHLRILNIQLLQVTRKEKGMATKNPGILLRGYSVAGDPKREGYGNVHSPKKFQSISYCCRWPEKRRVWQLSSRLFHAHFVFFCCRWPEKRRVWQPPQMDCPSTGQFCCRWPEKRRVWQLFWIFWSSRIPWLQVTRKEKGMATSKFHFCYVYWYRCRWPEKRRVWQRTNSAIAFADASSCRWPEKRRVWQRSVSRPLSKGHAQLQVTRKEKGMATC